MNKCVIIVTHSNELAKQADIIFRLKKGELQQLWEQNGYVVLFAAVKPVTGREDTILKNYPLYCPKCKQEVLIVVKDLQVTVIKEPDA